MKEQAKRLFAPENIPTITAFIASLIVVILDLLGRFDPQRIPEVILFCLSIMIAGMLIERLSFFERIQRSIKEGKSEKGVYGVYLNRNQLPPYEEFIENSRNHIIVISISLGETSTRYMDYLFELIKRKVKVTLLAFDPECPYLSSVAHLRGASEENLGAQIRTSLNLIEQYRSKIPMTMKHLLQLKVYDWSPTWGGIAVDPGALQGKLLVDVFQYNASIGTWPEFELRKGDGDGQLYDFYSNRFLKICEDATPWPRTSSQPSNPSNSNPQDTR